MSVKPVTESSWGEHLRTYRRNKDTIGWDAATLKKTSHARVTRYATSRKEREFNPVLQRYRDEAKEKSFVNSEKQTTLKGLNQARAKQLQHGQSYDIISHEVTIREPKFKLKNSIPATRVDYNIISNKNFSEHHWAEPGKRPEPRAKVESAQRNSIPREQVRAHNIISNRYKRQHTARSRADRTAAREEAAKRFWSSHDFNPVACAYYDPEKERAHHMQQQRLEEVQGQAQQARLPPVIAQSEGAAYDVVSQRVRNPALMADMEERWNQGVNMRKIAGVFERSVRDRMVRNSARDAARALNRVHPSRFEDGTRLGYDIVSQRLLHGMNKKPTFPHRAAIEPNVWQKTQLISQGALSGLASPEVEEAPAMQQPCGQEAVPEQLAAPVRLPTGESRGHASSGVEERSIRKQGGKAQRRRHRGLSSGSSQRPPMPSRRPLSAAGSVVAATSFTPLQQQQQQSGETARLTADALRRHSRRSAGATPSVPLSRGRPASADSFVPPPVPTLSTPVFPARPASSMAPSSRGPLDAAAAAAGASRRGSGGGGITTERPASSASRFSVRTGGF